MVTDYNAMSILDTPEIEEEEIVANPRISVAEASETYGKFVIGPLDPGYGVTLGNPLRRVLYNSLSGSAITWVQIEGILHEYSNIENVKEEVSEISGRGVGMDVVKSSLENIGATLNVHSKIDKGTSFIIQISKKLEFTLFSSEAQILKKQLGS